MYHTRNFCARVALLYVVLFFLIGGAMNSVNVASATTYTWTGAAGNSLWSGITGSTTNWNPNTLPPTTQSIAFTSTT
ncbi:MAG TPA: hypothetical protein VGM76_02840 [Lacipirellulaceae bacterium]|jgi:hypothetical protein